MSFQEGTLEAKPTDTPQQGSDKIVVRTALRIIEESRRVNLEKMNILDDIALIMKDAYFKYRRDSRNIPAQLINQVVFNLVTQMKPLDVQLSHQGAGKGLQRVVSQAVQWLSKESGYIDLFNSNFNGFYQQLAYGDFFAMAGSKENGIPEFKPVGITGLYFDTNATDLRTNGSGKAMRCVVIFKMGLEQAMQQYPEIKEKATVGSLPTSRQFEENQELQDMDEQQREEAEKNEIEVGYYFDISEKPYFAIIAGRTASVITELKGDDYPYYLNDGKLRENYLPLLQWFCFPSNEGIFNAGYGHVIQPIAERYAEMSNKAISHVQDNMDPYRIVNIPKKQAGRFLAKVKDAKTMRAKGQRPIIVNDIGAGDLGQGIGQMETMESRPMTQDYERIMQEFRKSLVAWGVNLEQVAFDPNQPLGSVEIQEENRSEIIRQIQEQNTETYRFAIFIMIDSIKKLNEKTDKELLDKVLPVSPLSDKEKEEDEAIGEIAEFEYTVRNFKEDLEAFDWAIEVNSRTGAYPSQVLQRARLQNAINELLTMGETGEARRLLVAKNKLSGINIDLPPMQQQPQGGQGEVGAEVQPTTQAGSLEAQAQPIQ